MISLQLSSGTGGAGNPFRAVDEVEDVISAQHFNQLVSSTSILKVKDADPFAVAEKPNEYLLDIFDHPNEAAALWHQRRQRDREWNEGLVQLRHKGVELIEASMVDDVVALWSYLLNLVEEFLEDGAAEVSFPDQPIPVILETVRGGTFFSVGKTRVMVELASFIASLVDEAERFFLWLEQHLGEAVPTNQMAVIRRETERRKTA